MKPQPLRFQPPVPSFSPRWRRGLGWLAASVLGAWVLHPGLTPTSGADHPAISPAGATSSLVRWTDATHDWLLVVDPATHELVVYDAVDGRPLRRVDAGEASFDSIQRNGNRLIATDRQRARVQVLSLPGLVPVALTAR